MRIRCPVLPALLAAALGGGCATPPPPTVESDLALLTLAAHHDAVTETDGTLEPHPAWLKVPEAYARFIGRGPGVIPDLMRIAKETPPFTWAALEMIAGIARETHAAPFTIPRESAACHYWVMTWAPGEGVSRISLRDIDSEREQALSAFETWLAGNGYLQKTGGGFYDIRGSSVFPIKTVLLGSRPGEVERELGKPPLVLTGNFREPAIVRLEDLPAFDLQWGYPEKNAASWVFFKQQKVVAAFREVMD